GAGRGGFGARLASSYSCNLRIPSHLQPDRVAGYNTEWAIPVLEQCLAAQQLQQHVPKIRILPSLQHVPLPSLFTISTYVHLIILITPPPVNSSTCRPLASRDPPLELDRLFDMTKQYAEGVKEAAAASKVVVVDVWTAMWKAAGENEQALARYLSDGLHLNADGYTVMYNALMATITAEYPELHYDNLQYVFPAWSEMDWGNPALSVQKREA
ncbi:hypothetical protein B0H13DRAFT_2062068, partial [Mycena leptocephala]